MCFRKNVCFCVCLSDHRRSQSLNQLTDFVQIRYLGSSCKYLEVFFFSFSPTPKVKGTGSSHGKKNTNLDFLALTALIKFCGFIVHSKPNNVILANFPGKIPETGKHFLNLFRLQTQGLIQLINLVQTRHIGLSYKYLQLVLFIYLFFFCFRSTLKIKGSSHKEKINLFIFSKIVQRFSSNFVGLLLIRTPTIWHCLFFSRKSL